MVINDNDDVGAPQTSRWEREPVARSGADSSTPRARVCVCRRRSHTGNGLPKNQRCVRARYVRCKKTRNTCSVIQRRMRMNMNKRSEAIFLALSFFVSVSLSHCVDGQRNNVLAPAKLV